MEESQNKNPIIAGVIAVVVVVILVGAVIALTSKKEEEDSEASVASTAQSQSAANDTQEQSAATATATAGTYKDGTYKATGTYNSPEGQESIDVSITISGNTVSDATVTSKATARESKTYQAAFISGYKQQVVGKNIDDIQLSKVSGSSLTPRGFTADLIKCVIKATWRQ